MMHLTPPKTFRWTDGRKFSRRVQVWGSGGRYMFRVHDGRALRLCQTGAARPADDFSEPYPTTTAVQVSESKNRTTAKHRGGSKRAAEIWCIVLPPLTAQRKGPPHPPSVYDYVGQRYVQRTPINGEEWASARPWEFKTLSPEAIYLLRQTVRECMQRSRH